MLPENPKVFFVHADSVLDRQRFSAAVTQMGVEVANQPKTITTQLQTVRTHPHTIFADVEGILSPLSRTGVTIGDDHFRQGRPVQN